MSIDLNQFNELIGKIDVLEMGGAIAVVAICATLFIVGYMARFKK